MEIDPGCCVDRKREDANGCNRDTCMKLPKGKTCADCVHIDRCVAIFGVTPMNNTCDFFPRRFADASYRIATSENKQ